MQTLLRCIALASSFASGEVAIAQTWIQRSSLLSPGPRSEGCMVFDALRGRTVLFGGGNSGGVLSDTWVPNRELLRAARRFSTRLA